MKETEFILNNKTDFLIFLKSRFTIIHNSNFFFRDFHYGIMAFLKEHNMKNTYQLSEIIARETSLAFETNGILKRIDHQSWVVNYPDFALPRQDKKTA
jgi:hypothetical protein